MTDNTQRWQRFQSGRWWGCLMLLLALTGPVHSGVGINEFLAENDGGWQDADGETPDWIELFNEATNAVNLAGWHLTDDPANPQKWAFPATNLPPLGYLVVFASGKDRAVAGAELHTNFRLDNQGGYLALMQPDGTAASSFTNYPPQRANASYGTAWTFPFFEWLATGSSARWQVPTQGADGLDWTLRDFNDSAWTSGITGIGYTASDLPWLSLDFDERGVTPLTQPGFSSFVINSNGSATASQNPPTVRQFDGVQVTLSNTAPQNYDDRVRNLPVNSSNFTQSALLRDFVFSGSRTNTGGLDLNLAGLPANQWCDVTIWSYDNSSPGSRRSEWSANGGVVVANYAFDGAVLPVQDGDYQMRFAAQVSASGQLLIQGRRRTDSVGSGGGADYGVFLNAIQLQGASLGALVATDIGSAMRGKNRSVYLRQTFLVTDPVTPQWLRLRVRYLDGFVAYLNGQRVASRNAPDNPAWDSGALTNRLLSQAAQVEEILIPNIAGLLTIGTNVLAIHGLAYATNGEHFLIAPELEGFAASALAGRYFAIPTPGSNNATGYSGFVADTKFSLDRGFYDVPFTVAITSATPQAVIYYTLNGSLPSPTNGVVYAGPISITNTTLLRASAHAPDLIATEADTHTYIFIESVLRQPNTLSNYPTTWQASYPADYEMDSNVVNHPGYAGTIRQDLRAIPTLSIVSDHDSFWNPARGIYVNSTSVHDETTGQNWERAASAELIQPDGSTSFQINCAVRIQGNASRDNNRLAKHSLRLLFKSDYGPAKLRHDWFNDGVSQFDNIILRACFTDAWATRYSDQTLITGGKGTRYRPEDSLLLRDVWVKDSLADMGHLAGRGDFVHLYLNGLYWGVYNPCERMDSSFCAEHLGGNPLDWDVLCGDAVYDFATLKDGSKDDWNSLMALVNGGVTNEAAYQAVAALVDLENLADYFILHILAEAEDWPFHNWFAVRRRANATNGLPATKWIFLPWDQEIVLDQLVRRDRTAVNNPDTPARIYGQLRAWPEFNRLFGDRVHKHLFNDGALTPTNNIARLLNRAARIERAIVGESARWGDAREFTIGSNPGHGQTFTRDEWWWPEINKLCTNFFPTLNDIALARLRNAGLYPALNAPAFSQFGGTVPQGFNLTLTHSNAAGAIYFTVDGTDPREYGTAAVSSSAAEYTSALALNTATLVRARVRNGTQWSALTEATFYPPQNLDTLVLTEIMYNPPAWDGQDGDLFEFVELWNRGTNALNLAGLQFSTGIRHTFPPNTWLGPNAYLVLVSDPTAFALKYPGVPITGVYTGRLDNAGERLTLADPLGGTVFSVSYSDALPWPSAPDDLGFSLVQKFPGQYQAPDNAAKWRASAVPGGSPGGPDAEPDIPRVVINEIFTTGHPPANNAVELRNLETTNVVIGGWFLTDDPKAPQKFRILDGTEIMGGGYRVFTEAEFNPLGGSNAFGLNPLGGQLFLFSGDTLTNLAGYTHGLNYGAAENGVTFGRHVNSVGEEQFPAQITATMDGDNAGPRIGPVVINEIMYHPPPGRVEYIELLNVTSNSVPLFDPDFPTNTWRLSGLDLNFPQGVLLAPGEFMILAATNPAAFRALYSVPAEVAILAIETGRLQDGGERLQLERPTPPATNGIAWIAVDTVRYNDKSPWPASPDGGGNALQRFAGQAYGDEPTNWFAARPSPGWPNPVDSDGDGLPDAWENEHGLAANNPADGGLDSDGDGHSNREEYLLGTNPNDPASVFKARIEPAPTNAAWLVRFDAPAQIAVEVQSTTMLPSADWQTLMLLPAALTNQPVSVPFTLATNQQIFLRLRATPGW